ncbi:helix-turn-helix domain-containing protein [Helicobacter sp. MIT 05-5294]|uniref:MarR family transcription factor RrpB n=1 Tax=Helicobacter sp. MIT 05-5294 TaxID=1548150 RepID=UPI0010FF1195|nr:helix-turn-helix domain-containing protein [Helicobacter sp. MIT 05-5294]TLD86189.1 transcriptional regulator [Helicobacter sp. MIT 05-5294]
MEEKIRKKITQKQANYYSPCPIETTLNLIGNKWKFLIIRDLLGEVQRFGELKKSISATKNQSISQKVLTQNLRELEDARLIKRKVYAEVPPRVEYSLTELGQSLKGVIESLEQWGEHYKALT